MLASDRNREICLGIGYHLFYLYGDMRIHLLPGCKGSSSYPILKTPLGEFVRSGHCWSRREPRAAIASMPDRVCFEVWATIFVSFAFHITHWGSDVQVLLHICLSENRVFIPSTGESSFSFWKIGIAPRKHNGKIRHVNSIKKQWWIEPFPSIWG